MKMSTALDMSGELPNESFDLSALKPLLSTTWAPFSMLERTSSLKIHKE